MNLAAGIYVDPLAATPTSRRWPWAQGCHLFHEVHDLAALDRFAQSIGMKLAWRHDAIGFPHYDLHATHRIKAVAAGAIEVDRRHPVMIAMFQRRREFLRGLANGVEKS